MTTVLRATLEAVISSQEKLRQMLDRLSADNRPISSEVERQEFMKLLSYATLGFGSEIEMRYENNLKKDVETVARWLSYQGSSMVSVPVELYKQTATSVHRIGGLWECLRNHLFIAYPIALKHACSMSKEQEGTKKATGYSIEVNNENKENTQ